MDPLKRDNSGVRATNHEDRIQALERRIIPPPPVYAWLRKTTDQAASGTTLLTWDDFKTTDRGVFATSVSGVYPDDNDAPGDTLLKIKQEGLVTADLRVVFETGAFQRSCLIASSSSEPWIGVSDATPSANTTLDQPVWAHLVGTNYIFGSPEILEFFGSAAGEDVTEAVAFVFFWAADALATNVY